MKRPQLLTRINELKVTAVVPVYNGGKYLIESVNSIMAQRNSSFEVVIINDGSDQETESIIAVLTDKSSENLHVIHNEGNRGTTRAWYQGLECGSKRNGVILTLAQDDLLPNLYMSSVAKTLVRDNTVAVCTNLIPIDPNGKILRGILASPMTSIFGKYQTAWIFGLNLINAPGSMITRGVNPHEYLKRNFPYTHDLHLWLHLSTLGRIRVSGKSNCFYRLHSESVTANRNFEDFHIELTNNRREFIQNETFTRYVKPLRRYQRKIFYALVTLATSRESNCEHRSEWDSALRVKLGLKTRENFKVESCNLVDVSPLTRGYSRKKKRLNPRNEALNNISSLIALIRIVITSLYFALRKFLFGGL